MRGSIPGEVPNVTRPGKASIDKTVRFSDIDTIITTLAEGDPGYVDAGEKSPLTLNDLMIVNQMLRAKHTISVGQYDDWECEAPAPTPEGGVSEGKLVPRLAIRYMDMRDDQGMTVSAIDGMDDSRWALEVMAGNQDAIRYEFAHTALPIFGTTRGNRYRLDALEQQALAAAPSGTGSVESHYQPMVQGYRLNMNVGRRPEQRELSNAPQGEIDAWFRESGIQEGGAADDEEKRQRARRLAYTWRDCFAFCLEDIEPTDLITHNINLIPDAIPYRLRQPSYTRDMRVFAQRFYGELRRAGWVWPGVSEWAAHARFPPKKTTFRAVVDYRPVNSVTILPQWPTHQRDHVFEDILQAQHSVFYQGDAAHGFHGVLVSPGDEYKAAFVVPNSQLFTNRMPQGMAGSPHSYCALGDVTYGEWPAVGGFEGPALPSLIGHHPEWRTSFNLFVDDHAASGKTFDDLFDFLHHHYFPRTKFGRINLSPSKTVLFASCITALGFELAAGTLRPSEKHRDRFARWALEENHPRTREQLEEFLYLLPYLKELIPGRAAKTLVLKTAFQVQTNKKTPTGRISKQREWQDKPFEWTQEHAATFRSICQEIQSNVNDAPDETLQFHLSSDASGVATGAVLFQIAGTPPGTQMTDAWMKRMRTVMYISFRLEDAETRYHIGERETLGVVKALLESRRYILPSQYPTFVYTDHLNMLSTLSVEGNPTGKIASWLDTLGSFNIRIVHRPGSSRVIQIADGLSRLTNHLTEKAEKSPAELMGWTAQGNGIAMTSTPAGEEIAGNVLPFSIVNLSVLKRGIKMDKKYATSDWYEAVVRFLIGGREALGEEAPPARRLIMARAVSYRIRHGVLQHHEGHGLYAPCILEEEVANALQWAHSVHGHYAAPSTLHQLRGKMWWPTRGADVRAFLADCQTCAAVSTHVPLKTDPIPVVALEPWDLVGTDYSGRVRPLGYEGSSAIHVKVDYMTGFILASPTPEPTAEVTERSWVKTAAVFGFPRQVYSDNAGYFRSARLGRFFRERGTEVSFGPVYSPSSMGKAEMAVRMIKQGLKKWARERNYENLDRWPDAIHEITASVNSRLTKGARYSPAEVMLGWPLRLGPIPGESVAEAERQQIQEAAVAIRGGQLDQGQMKLAMMETRRETRDEHRQRMINHAVDNIPDIDFSLQVGQLVWEKVPEERDSRVRNYRVGQRPQADGGERAKAFEPKWTGPWEVVARTSRVTYMITDPGIRSPSRKVHIGNLKPYQTNPDRFISVESSQPNWLIGVEEVDEPQERGSEDVDLRPTII